MYLVKCIVVYMTWWSNVLWRCNDVLS